MDAEQAVKTSGHGSHAVAVFVVRFTSVSV